MFEYIKDIVSSVKETNKEIVAESKIKHANRSLQYIRTQLATMPKHGRTSSVTKEVVQERVNKIFQELLKPIEKLGYLSPMEYLDSVPHYDLDSFLYTQEEVHIILKEIAMQEIK